MNPPAQFSVTGPHLGPPARLAIPSARHLATDGVSVAYVAAGATLHVVDLADRGRPALLTSLVFRSDIDFVELRGTTLLVGEHGRAIDFVDVSDPARPRWFECLLAFGAHVYPGVVSTGDRLVVPLNWEGVGLCDVADPARSRWLARVKLDQGYVEHVAVADGKVFAAGASGGLRVFAIDGESLVEVARPGGPGFHATAVHRV
ncbi:MAG: hypothetical protein ABMA64_09985, partial [Myxococcota bacterium]